MMNLKNFFYPNPYSLTVTKTEKEILELFLSARPAFEKWLAQHPQPRIRFQFYFPTAIDFYFDEYKLFTAYYKKDIRGKQVLAELKISRDNYDSIRVLSWKPFEEVMVNFLQTYEESSKVSLFQQTKALYDYASICEDTPVMENQKPYSRQLNPAIAAG